MTGAGTGDGASTPTDPADGRVQPRRLRVLVGWLPIEDGQVSPPVVGEVSVLTLTFVEAPSDDGLEATVSEVRARAEPRHDGRPLGPGRLWDGTEREGPVTWPTVLHGDGWSAIWSAPRPVIGRVHLRGRLVDDLDIDARIPVRGLVTRVQVVTETIDTSDPDQQRWRPIPGEQRLRDVDTAPRWFDDGMVAPPDAPRTGWHSRVPADPWVREVGVLVDLDLDHVPALPPRPRIVPGALAVDGADLWVADARLPLLMRVRHPLADLPEVTEFTWPGRILTVDESPFRQVHADPTGCWVTGPDGVHRADQDGGGGGVGGAVEVDTRPVTGTVATVEGVLAAAVFPEPDSTGMRLRRWRPDGIAVDDVDLGDGHVEGLVATADAGFLALCRHLPRDVPCVPHQQPTRLIAVAEDGTVARGPELQVAGSLHPPLLAGDPPVIDDSRASPGALRRVRADLTVDDGEPSRRMLLGGYAAAGRLWVLAHPPHPQDIARRGLEACWPLTAPPSYPDDRQYWLLTELDPVTLEPLVSHLVPHSPRHLAVDDRGTVWILADGLRRLPADDGAAAQPFDLAALLGTTPPETGDPAAR